MAKSRDNNKGNKGEKNLPPVAVITASKAKIKLPENSITLDLSQSSDPNKNGVITKFEFAEDSNSKDATITVSGKTAKVDFAKAGTYNFTGKVTDRGGLSGTAKIPVIVEPADVKKTVWGASGKGITPQVLKTLFGPKTVTRQGIMSGMYKGNNGDGPTNSFLDADITVFLNINTYPYNTPDGVNTGTPFVTDMDDLRRIIIPLLDFYKDHPKRDLLFLSYLNEPTTAKFNTGPMQDYLKGLEVFVEECVKRGLKCTDGGVHVDTVLGVDLSDQTGEGRASDVEILLNGYAKIKGMYAVLLHTSNASGNTYDPDRIGKAIDKIKQITGYNTISNEWHVQDKSANKDQVKPDLVATVASGWKDKVEYCVYITGTSDKNCQIVDNSGHPTPFGQAYLNFIQNAQS